MGRINYQILFQAGSKRGSFQGPDDQERKSDLSASSYISRFIISPLE